MANNRPKGVFGVGLACIDAAIHGRTEHRPTSADYPETVIRRVTFTAGGGLGWRVSALRTVRNSRAPWKIVVVTGAPSWAEYWAPVMAALPADREMIVVDRPGFAGSEPTNCIPDIALQARALAPLLLADRGQKIILIGQSYGGAIATLMAEANPGRVAALVLLSSYLGEPGPTARRLLQLGSRMAGLIPRDLRNAVTEIACQPTQLATVKNALERVRAPVHVIHGDADDFAPIATARALVERLVTCRPVHFREVRGADHFLNDGPVDVLISHIEACIPRQPPKPMWPWLQWLRGRSEALSPVAVA